MTNLKPCPNPACGSSTGPHHTYYMDVQGSVGGRASRIRCSKCCTAGPLAPSEHDAAEAWNAFLRSEDASQRRPSSASPAVATLLDQFAMAAIGGMLANPETIGSYAVCAQNAFSCAKAMLAAREQKRDA